MNKKILVFSNYGGLMPEAVLDVFNKGASMLVNRSNKVIIEKLENASIWFDESIHTTEWFKKNPKALVFYSKTSDTKNDYLGYNSEQGIICRVSIVTVDTNRKWTIESYDGAEGVKYLDDMVCVDKELNCWVRRENI